ncbi:MAG: hypothetical protein IKC65_00795 [Lentisphaeria bacterium]|nr:hypothetical protein [Lentisphaeria bacterium]
MKHPSSENGSALVAVLGLIFTAGMLTAAILALSRTGTFEVLPHVARQRSMYILEGAGNRIQYLLAADRYLNDDVTLGELDYSEFDYERYVADGVPHLLDYYGEAVEFVITDAASGFPMTASSYTQTLQRMARGFEDDSEWNDKLTEFHDKLADYIDSDTDVKTDGMESGEYEELPLYNLPRNAAPQFREELLWIPGARELFPPDKNGRFTRVTIIPPEKMGDIPVKPSLMTADELMLRTYCGLDEDEAKEVLESLRRLRTDRELLSETLDPLIAERLSNLAVKESGFYTVDVKLSSEDKKPSARFSFSFEGFSVTGPADKTVRFLDWMIF